MIIFDTNVVSELLRPSPEPRVEGWLAVQDGFDIYLTAISEAELRYGVAIMGNGKRRDGLADAVDRILRDDMAGRVLAFDSAAAEACHHCRQPARCRPADCAGGLPDCCHRARPRRHRRDPQYG